MGRNTYRRQSGETDFKGDEKNDIDLPVLKQYIMWSFSSEWSGGSLFRVSFRSLPG